jgi:NADPH-dependent ferric siderophore reductase
VMHASGTIDRFIDATFAVPTRSEAYKYAAYDGLMRLEKRQAARSVDLKSDPAESGRVVEAIRLAPKVTNVRIACDSLAGYVFEGGADVLLRLPEDRRYSVWKSSADGTFEICVVGHGMGPGSRWASNCKAGDTIAFARSKALPIALDPEARAHVFIGDETSVAGAEALIRNIPIEVPVLACFETPSEAERWPRDALGRPDSIRWIDRSGRPGAAMIEWLKSRTEPLPQSATAYVTGETWLCAMVHSHLSRDRGFAPAKIRAMPYWKQRRA